MFGYIRPCRPELKLKEDALFRAYYCGVCKSLGRRSGPLCRALLRYDLAFLALLRDGLLDDAHAEALRCPLKGNKLNMMQGESVSFAADAHLILSWGKLRDDRRDGHGALAAAGSAALGPAVKRAAALHPALMREMEEMLRAQSALEAAGCKEPDDAAEPFAQFLAALFAAGMPEAAQPSLRYMGRNLGKWIYWLDALDDYDKDAKKGAYNVWRAAGFSREAACRWALPLLAQCICQARLAYDVLDAGKTGALVENVLNEGMPRVMDAVAEGRRLDDGSI